MNIWVVIPTKPFAQGKTRLSAVLSPRDREELNRAFFRRTLRLAASLVPHEHIVVASRSTEAQGCAQSLGAHTVAETAEDGLNEALEQAARFAARHGAEGVLSLSCDLPLLETDDLATMLERPSGDSAIVLAGDRSASGTNALAIFPPLAVPYRYGPDSYRAHIAAATSVGATVKTVARPGLAFDIDMPAHLAEWRSRKE